MKQKNSIFKRIINSFDKHVVIPITRIVLKITKSFDKSSHRLEVILSKQTTLLFLSLFIAVTLFVVVDQKMLVFNNRSAEMLRDQKIEVLYNEERFVLEGIPETVDITLMGSKADLYMARQAQNEHNVKLDLTDITEPGTYSRKLQYDSGELSSIESSVNPSEATVIVYLKESQNRSLSYNVINTDHLDNALDIDNVSLNIDEVVISGAKYKLDQVATVEALIDVNKLPSLEAGEHVLDDITLCAYDSNGNIVDVEINHSAKPKATLTISSSSREIPLNLVIENEMPFGKAIDSYKFSQDTVLVYGSQEVLEQLAETGIDITYDASKLTNDYKGKIEIPKPAGIRKLGTNRIEVEINVTNSVSLSKYNMTVRIDALNTPKGYTAGAASSNDAEVLVKPTCSEKICSALSNADIEAYVDLSSLAGSGPGTYEVPVKIKPRTSNARLATFVVSPEKVKIKLTRN